MHSLWGLEYGGVGDSGSVPVAAGMAALYSALICSVQLLGPFNFFSLLSNTLPSVISSPPLRSVPRGLCPPLFSCPALPVAHVLVMAGPAKRTRHHDENSASPADSASSTTAAPAAPTAADSSTPTATPPTTRANPASRRPATRSTQSNNTLFTVATRQTNSALNATGSMPAPSCSVMRGVGRAGVSGGSGRAVPAGPSARSGGSGMLLRTQSAPVIASAVQIKTAAGAGGGEAAPPKGGHDGLGLGERRFGKGKENIPPKKDEDQQPEPARKRMRVTSRGSYSGQGGRKRSGSVNSVRSETTSSKCSLFPLPQCRPKVLLIAISLHQAAGIRHLHRRPSPHPPSVAGAVPASHPRLLLKHLLSTPPTLIDFLSVTRRAMPLLTHLLKTDLSLVASPCSPHLLRQPLQRKLQPLPMSWD